MSRSPRIQTGRAPALPVAFAAIAAFLVTSCRPERPARTVTLHMSGYAFNDSNPTLTFGTGERVRFVLTNDETTMIRHNFRITSLDVPCDYELGPGEGRVVEVTMPDRPGAFGYDCCTHKGMGGTLVVERR